MTKRLGAIVTVGLVIAVLAGGAAWAQHGRPPTYIDVGPMTITISVESTNGQVYHDNAPGEPRSGQSCTTASNPPDDLAGDDATECWNSRDQLRGKNVGAAEGGAANCQAAPNLNASNQVVFDGVWMDQCPTDPPNPDTKGRVYTGVAVGSVGNGGLAAGGDAGTRGGCVQAFGEDDTPGNLIKTTTDTLQTLGDTPHGGTDDDTDVTVCGDA